MIVLDCSAAVEMARGTTKGIELLAQLESESVKIVPSLFYSEAANAVWKYVHAGQWEADKAVEAFERISAMPSVIVKTERLSGEALREACRLDHSVYDMTYVVLARRTGATLVTLDKHLAGLCSQLGVATLLA